MIKKALLSVMAAGALSVPLAGVAWADRPDPNGDPNGEGIGPGGVPGKIGRLVDAQGGTTDGHIPPGTGEDPDVFGNSDIAKLPGSVLDILGISPGSVVKAVTPGCKNGSLGCPTPPPRPPTDEPPTDTGGGDDTSSPGGTGEDTGSSPSSGGSDTGSETGGDAGGDTSSSPSSSGGGDDATPAG